MSKIKCISRSWLYPSGTGATTDECYTVGVAGVVEIKENYVFGHDIVFNTGCRISVSGSRYIEYFTEEEKPEFPEDRVSNV